MTVATGWVIAHIIAASVVVVFASCSAFQIWREHAHHKSALLKQAGRRSQTKTLTWTDSITKRGSIPIVKFWLHRILLLCMVFQGIRCIDPHGLYGIFGFAFLSLLNNQVTTLIFVAANIYVDQSLVVCFSGTSGGCPKWIRKCLVASCAFVWSGALVCPVLEVVYPENWTWAVFSLQVCFACVTILCVVVISSIMLNRKLAATMKAVNRSSLVGGDQYERVLRKNKQFTVLASLVAVFTTVNRIIAASGGLNADPILSPNPLIFDASTEIAIYITWVCFAMFVWMGWMGPAGQPQQNLLNVAQNRSDGTLDSEKQLDVVSRTPNFSIVPSAKAASGTSINLPDLRKQTLP